jgi:hypothetical protein
MENPAFTKTSLSDGKVIMAIMYVLSLDLLCQAVMGRVPVLECLLLGARVCQRLRPILFGFKWPRSLRELALGLLAQYQEPPSMVTRGLGAC